MHGFHKCRICFDPFLIHDHLQKCKGLFMQHRAKFKNDELRIWVIHAWIAWTCYAFFSFFSLWFYFVCIQNLPDFVLWRSTMSRFATCYGPTSGAVTPVYSWHFCKPSGILDFRLSPGRETTTSRLAKSSVVAVVLSEKSTFWQVRDHPELGAYVPGLTEAPCSEACSLLIFLKIRYHWYHFKYHHNQFYLWLFEVFSDSWFSCASNKLTTTSDQRCEELVGLRYQKVLSLVHSHATKTFYFHRCPPGQPQQMNIWGVWLRWPTWMLALPDPMQLGPCDSSGFGGSTVSIHV